MKILFSIVLFVFLAPVFTSAVNINYTPLAPIPGTGDCPTSDPNCLPAKVQNLGGYLRGIYMTGVALAGLFVVFSIVRGGFTLLFTDSVLGKTEGKGMILHALGGLLIVFSSFLLMNTINPQLGRDLNLNLAFPQKNITPFIGQVAPITYGQMLDQTLGNIKAISVKAQNLKAAGDALDGRVKEIERKIRDGDFTPEEIADNGEALNLELNALRPKLQEIRDAETLVRKFENTTEDINLKRLNMAKCLNGSGPCFDPNGSVLRNAILGRSAAQIATDQAVAQSYLTGMRNTVNQNAAELEGKGFTEQAADLRARLATTEKMFDFWTKCPASNVFVASWQTTNTVANCPH